MSVQELNKKTVSFVLSVEDHPPKVMSAAYIDVGIGPTILFVHGFSTDATVWTPFIDILKTQYRCISLDVLGFGDSSKLDIDYRVESLTLFTKKFMETLQIDKYYAIGHSLGGWIIASLDLATNKSIKGLILLAPAGIAEDIGKFQKFKPLSWETPIIDWILRALFLIGKVLNRSYTLQKILSLRYQFLYEPVFRAWMKRAFNLKESDELLKDKAIHIKSRTLIIAGESDEIIPLWHCEHYNSCIPNSTLRVIPNADHHLLANNAEQIASLIKSFLNGKKNV